MMSNETASDLESAGYKKLLGSWTREYHRSKRPVEVAFRDVVSFAGYPDRATHLIHPYPAKLLVHIPYVLLRTYGEEGDRVLDPFCGSGTVLLEAMLARRQIVGADANPLARFISRVKTRNLNSEQLASDLQRLSDIPLSSEGSAGPVEFADVVNAGYWYSERRLAQLCELRDRLGSISDADRRDFFLICFSVCARNVSNADPRIAVPVRLRPNKYRGKGDLARRAKVRLEWLQTCDVLAHFSEICERNIARVEELSSMLGNHSPSKLKLETDARTVSTRSKYHLILTSPPYAGAQKYIRSSSLNLGWLGYTPGADLQCLKKHSIGREFFRAADYSELRSTGITEADQLISWMWKRNRLRAHIASTYLLEMRASFSRMVKALKPAGRLILIAADTTALGRPFRNTVFFTSMLAEFGLQKELELVDGIRGRTLLTKRNGAGSVIKNEHVMVFS